MKKRVLWATLILAVLLTAVFSACAVNAAAEEDEWFDDEYDMYDVYDCEREITIHVYDSFYLTNEYYCDVDLSGLNQGFLVEKCISDDEYDLIEEPYYLLTAQKTGTYYIKVDDYYGWYEEEEGYWEREDPTIKINVLPVDMNDCSITGFKDLLYTGAPVQQKMNISYNGHKATFSAEYFNNINPCEDEAYVDITGTGNFTGSKRLYFSIRLPQAAFSNFKLAKTAIRADIKQFSGEVYYQLQFRKSGGTWQNYDLKSATTKTFSGLKNKAKYDFRVRTYALIDGDYQFGTWSKVQTRTAGLSLADCKISGIKNKIYNGKAQPLNIKVTYKGKAIKVKVKYSDNKNIGYRYVTITGTGDFVDSVKKYYYIIPQTTKITGLIEKFNEDDWEFNRAALQYNKCGGGVTGYQIAVQVKGGNWKYYKTKNVKYTLKLVEGKIYTVTVRAYKQWADGTVVYGNWAAKHRVFPVDKTLSNNYIYKSQNVIKGYVTNALKGTKILVTIGGKTYTAKVTKDSKKFYYSLKVGYHSAGTKITLKYANEFGQGMIKYTDIVYYTDYIKVGYSQSMVKLVPDYRYPTRIYESSYGETWYYEWGDYDYGWVYFDSNGKVWDWEFVY
ncbi:MAG: hypothetical protein E7517_00350 [Ruminococcaceae bacterium]|nr:hypothetical protein [Oscillospiraceae bacterium]